MSDASLPEGYKAPAAGIDADHHGGWLVICSAFGLVITIITLLIRMYLRFKVSPPFSMDDFTLVFATILTVIQSSLLFGSVNRGYGTSLELLPEDATDGIQKLNYASDIFYVLALYATKACVVLLFQRISTGIAGTSHRLVGWLTLGFIILFGIISVFLVALRCNLSEPWNVWFSSCDTFVPQWQAITAFDIITEIVLFGMSIHLVWDLQTPFWRKCRVVFAFALRLPVIAAAATHLHFAESYISSPNPSLFSIIATICQQTELFYSIMSSTIPCLRPFLAGFSTNFGAMGGDTVIAGSQVGNSSGHGGRSGEKGGSQFMLSSLSSSSGIRKGPGNGNGKRALRSMNGEDEFGDPQCQTSVTHNVGRESRGDAASVSSGDSTRMIIKKEVQWHVDSEGDAGLNRFMGAGPQSHTR